MSIILSVSSTPFACFKLSAAFVVVDDSGMPWDTADNGGILVCLLFCVNVDALWLDFPLFEVGAVLSL